MRESHWGHHKFTKADTMTLLIIKEKGAWSDLSGCLPVAMETDVSSIFILMFEIEHSPRRDRERGIKRKGEG